MRALLQIAVICLCVTGSAGIAAPQAVSAQVFTEPAKPAARKPAPSRPARRAPAARPAPRQSREREVARVEPAPPLPPPTLAEPEAYCAANPQAAGPRVARASAVPNWITKGWALASGSAASSGSAAMQWKCSRGRLLACASLSGDDRCAKPSNLTQATPEMISYCASRRRGVIPRTVTGNTLANWVCQNRQPTISGYRTDVDADGYLAGTWLDVTPFAPANMAGDIPRAYLANWAVPVKTGALPAMVIPRGVAAEANPRGFDITFSAMQIDGGALGNIIGTNAYYGESAAGIAPSGCEAKLFLTAVTATSITVTERYFSQQRGCRKAETFMLQARDGQLLVNTMVRGNPKPRRSVWAQPFR